VPTLIKASLPSYRISIKNAKEWSRKYNYKSIPYIHKDKFWRLIIKAARGANLADIKSKVRSVIKQRNAQSYKEFKKQVYKILLPSAELFPN
jgi:hypothetical protein